jgi:predicted nucleic acid-binding protein
MKRLFVDTGAWYALVDRNDPEHIGAKGFFETNAIPLITSNFVFGETITLLRMRLGWSVAKDFGQRLKGSGFVGVHAVKEDDERRAWEIFLKYKDKDFSYTDCTSFALMERLKIESAFSFDSHFRTMKFHVLP